MSASLAILTIGIVPMQEVLPLLTEKETDVFKRARNHHASSPAKNASIGDYKKATGFEAVIGYLYLTGNTRRLSEIIKIGYEKEE